jgi:hypothetical protein
VKRQTLNLNDYQSLAAAYHGESDRSAIVLAGSFAEHYLATYLRHFMIQRLRFTVAEAIGNSLCLLLCCCISGNNLAYPPFSKVVRYDMLPVLSLPASTTLVDLNRHGAASDYFGPLIFHKVWCQLVPVIPSFNGI